MRYFVYRTHRDEQGGKSWVELASCPIEDTAKSIAKWLAGGLWQGHRIIVTEGELTDASQHLHSFLCH